MIWPLAIYRAGLRWEVCVAERHLVAKCGALVATGETLKALLAAMDSAAVGVGA